MNAHNHAASGSSAELNRRFLKNVLVWPADINTPTGWINVHVNAKNDDPAKNGGKPWVVG